MHKAAGDGWITVPTAARLLGLQLHTVYRLIDTGEICGEQTSVTVRKRGDRLGQRRSVRLRRQDVDDFIHRSRIRPGDLRHLVPPREGDW